MWYLAVSLILPSLLFLCASAPAPSASAAHDAWTTYTSPGISFSYPSKAGPPAPGADAASARRPFVYVFPLERRIALQALGLTGELVVTSGHVLVGYAGVGLLYDPGVRAFPVGADTSLAELLVPLTVENFCDHLRFHSPIDTARAVELGLRPNEILRLVELDSLGVSSDDVRSCIREDSLIVFHRRRGALHTYGAIRFSDSNYSSVQFVQSTYTAPTSELMDAIRRLVASVSMSSTNSHVDIDTHP